MILLYIRTPQVYVALVSLCMLAVFFFPAGALAQSTTTGAVAGRVTGPSQAVIPNAAVTLRSVATGAVRTAATGANGTFHFAFLQPASNPVSIIPPALEVNAQAGTSMAIPRNSKSSTNFLYQGGMVR